MCMAYWQKIYTDLCPLASFPGPSTGPGNEAREPQFSKSRFKTGASHRKSKLSTLQYPRSISELFNYQRSTMSDLLWPPSVKVERASCWDMKNQLVMTLAILISKVQSCPTSSGFPHLQFLITYYKLKVGRRPGNEVDQGMVVILTFAEDHKFCTCTNLWDEIPCFQRYMTGKVQINLYVNDKECQAALTNISINTPTPLLPSSFAILQ